MSTRKCKKGLNFITAFFWLLFLDVHSDHDNIAKKEIVICFDEMENCK